jgi:site-specific DNA recombinase
VRKILANPRYKGIYHWKEETHEIPAIVTEETWERARQVARDNFSYSPRNTRRNYLLRGLIKCKCGLTYSGWNGWGYACTGRLDPRGRRGPDAVRCDSPNLPQRLEEAVWADIEEFLRNPQSVLDQLARQQGAQGEQAEALAKEMGRLRRQLGGKAQERNAVITLGVRGQIDEAEMEAQRGRILREEEALKAEIGRLQARMENAESTRAALSSAAELLADLNRKVDTPWTFEEKRRVVETLVMGITTGRDEDDAPVVRVRYRFTPVPSIVAPSGSRQSGSSLPARRRRSLRGW